MLQQNPCRRPPLSVLSSGSMLRWHAEKGLYHFSPALTGMHPCQTFFQQLNIDTSGLQL